MAIIGRSLEDAARKFTDYLNGILCKTLTETRLQMTPVKGQSCVNIGFRQAGHPEEACFNSDYGWLSLSLSQNCGSRIEDGVHALRTMGYWYYLYASDGNSLMRWEFHREYPTRANWAQNRGKPEKEWVEPKYYARHHIQGDIPLALNGNPVPLNDLHTPTGYVPIEDIIRFCIEDLGARFADRPKNWHQILVESYGKFCTEFTQGTDWDGDR
jgi:hypothetical protein